MVYIGDKTQDSSIRHVWVVLLAVKPGFSVYIWFV